MLARIHEDPSQTFAVYAGLENPSAILMELEIVTLIRTQFDQTNDEVNQSPNSTTTEGENHQDTKTDLTTQKTVYAQAAEKETHINT